MSVDGSLDQRDATKHVGKRVGDRDDAGDSGRVGGRVSGKKMAENWKVFACRLGRGRE